MTKQDLTTYLNYLAVIGRKNRNDVKYQGGTDMSKEIDKWAIEAINKYYNE